jgi:hypothetical protein
MTEIPPAKPAPHKDWRYYVVICAYLLLDRLLRKYLEG